MLTSEQILLVGLVASALTQILKFLAVRFGYNPSQEVVNIALFVVAVGLAAAFGLPALEPTTDPAQLATLLLQAAAMVVGVATLVYNLLLEKVVYPALRLG